MKIRRKNGVLDSFEFLFQLINNKMFGFKVVLSSQGTKWLKSQVVRKLTFIMCIFHVPVEPAMMCISFRTKLTK